MVVALENLLKTVDPNQNCAKSATQLLHSLQSQGYSGEIKRIFHKSNVLAENPWFSCDHVCGESWIQHFVVSSHGMILDPRLGYPIKESRYLETAYINFAELQMS